MGKSKQGKFLLWEKTKMNILKHFRLNNSEAEDRTCLAKRKMPLRE